MSHRAYGMNLDLKCCRVPKKPKLLETECYNPLFRPFSGKFSKIEANLLVLSNTEGTCGLPLSWLTIARCHLWLKLCPGGVLASQILDVGLSLHVC